MRRIPIGEATESDFGAFVEAGGTPTQRWIDEATDRLSATMVRRGIIPPPQEPNRQAIKAADTLIARVRR
jgi:hypothetical protein